ncbi:zinc finger CCCH domain-containing protein ZFN-like isoform X2 [Carex littledalei]|uniref:Zinc finger CCCH domain-containing protein ZFN-like isoform X2 n=1 Tax=Carex littledalei TaxID=544730 RepID=A0A833QZ50_9POAL|nr:zinc finger CCCH domain-containing protein ZFN-like isoform X2 [Carex littledalei]
MLGEDDPSRTPYDLGLARSPPPIDSGAIDEAPSSLKLQEVRTVEIVVGEMTSERKEGSDGEREEAWDADVEKKEIEEGEEGIDSDIEKTENEELVESRDNDSKKIGTQKREEGIDGDNGIIETKKREEGIDGDNGIETEKRVEGVVGDSENVERIDGENIKIESHSNSEKKKSEDKEQVKNVDSEKEIGDIEQRIDCGSEHEKIEEKGEVRDVGSKNKEVDSDDYSEDTVEEKEEERDWGNEKKEGEKLLKERVKFPIPYPQRPFTKDCPSYLKTGHCTFGLICCFNHPLRKSGKVSPNRDCKDRERDGDQAKNEFERVKVMCAQPYPQREGKEDCLYYMKTGHCSYGANCYFNHPPRNPNQVTEGRKDQIVPDDKNSPREAERNWAVGPTPSHIRRRPDCVRYVKEGRCDFGAECRFFHHRSTRFYEFNLNPRSDWQENFELETNFLGLPLRPGSDDCPEYMIHGVCELSTDCQYNHPNPGPVIAKQDTHKELYKGDSLPSLKEHAAHVPSPTSILPPSIKPMFIPTPNTSLACIKRMLLPPERPDIGDGNKELQAQQSSSSTTTRSNSSGSGGELLEYPERPGEPLCPAYMKSGGCKLKSECWYDHPRDRHPKDPVKPFEQSDGYNRESSVKDAKKKMVPRASVVSENKFIYPERPGEPECAYYMKHGDCKFGSTCKFHHPKHLHKAPKYSSFSQDSRVMSGNGSEEMEYPERPGEPECAYYMMHGNCKFGLNCKFHHPKGQNEKKSSQWGYRNKYDLAMNPVPVPVLVYIYLSTVNTTFLQRKTQVEDLITISTLMSLMKVESNASVNATRMDTTLCCASTA